MATTIVSVDPKDPIKHLYCGPKNMKPLTTYTLFKDLNDHDFVVVRPHGLVFVRMGRTQGDVVKDEENENFKMVKAQWWVPMKKDANLDEQHYMKIVGMASGNVILQIQNNGLTFHLFFSHFQPKKNSNKSQITILVACANRVKINLDATNGFSNV